MPRTEIQSKQLPSFSPELDWLLSALFNLEKTATSPEELDEGRLLKLVGEHRVEALLAEKINELKGISERFKMQLLQRAQETSRQALFYTGELFRLCKLLADHKIPCMSLKGPLLAYHLYSDFTKRSCRDLDLLIHPQNVSLVKELMLAENYRVSGADFDTMKQQQALLRSTHHLNFLDQEEEKWIEIHWKLTASPFLPETFHAAVWEQPRIEQIRRQEIFSLNPLDEFIYLCIHGMRHRWFRLFWLADVYTILKQQGPDFFKQALQRSEHFGLKIYLLQTLDILDQLAALELTDELRAEIAKFGAIKSLTRISVESMAEAGESSAFRDASRHYRCIQLQEGLAGVFREIIVRRTKPLNWKFFAFPDRFFFLNTVCSRSIWIMRKLSRKP